MESKVVNHTIEPLFNENSKVLLLGTIPSPKSREAMFYYSHPQNKFWKVMASILDDDVPINNEEKKNLMLKNNIALWDVLASCKIKGASDESIEEPVANDINYILHKADIKTIFTTGTKAYALYKKYCLKDTGVEAVKLPSTSPANCRFYNLEKLIIEYKIILKYIK